MVARNQVRAGHGRGNGPGPAMFRQTRAGRNAKPFVMFKFRTMYSGAERRTTLIDDRADGLLFKIRDDPRVTRVGKFLRRYSLDELPQLINVLRGDMSLVGPRPPLPGEVEQYDLGAARRLLVKPGLTNNRRAAPRSYCSTSPGKGGRGPTSDMSPRRTLIS